MATTNEKHTAGAFDVRNIIGALLGIYGVILTVVGLFGDTSTLQGDTHANLYAGIVLLAVGVGFLAWARLKPVVVPADFDADAESEAGTPPGH